MPPGPVAVLLWHDRLAATPRLRVRPDADALADPDRARPQHASQFARLRQVEPIMGAQREVLMIAGQGSLGLTAAVAPGTRRPTPGAMCWPGAGPSVWRGEPVVGVRPRRLLLGILPGRADPRGQVQQLVPAALADSRERDGVAGQLQRYLIGLPDSITAAHCLDRQDRSIYTAQRPHDGTLTSARRSPTPRAPRQPPAAVLNRAYPGKALPKGRQVGCDAKLGAAHPTSRPFREG